MTDLGTHILRERTHHIVRFTAHTWVSTHLSLCRPSSSFFQGFVFSSFMVLVRACSFKLVYKECCPSCILLLWMIDLVQYSNIYKDKVEYTVVYSICTIESLLSQSIELRGKALLRWKEL